MLLYYITDRSGFPGDEASRRRSLLRKIADAAAAGVDYIQLREKDLNARELEALAREAVSVVRDSQEAGRKNRTALLVNSRTDVALAAGADGIHLPANDASPPEVRAIFRKAAIHCERALISVACHSPQEVAQAAAQGANLALFAPVFEKRGAAGAPPQEISGLRQACAAPIPVLALGGITLDNAESCRRAGAAGFAAIRLFQEHDVGELVSRLRGAE